MTPQRRSKAIDDYPSKFDWPGIKGLNIDALFKRKKKLEKQESKIPSANTFATFYLIFYIQWPIKAWSSIFT